MLGWSDCPVVVCWHQKMVQKAMAAGETGSKNSLTGGDCGGAGGHDRYDWKAGHEAVMGVIVRWPGVRRRLAGGGPK